jgi:integrase
MKREWIPDTKVPGLGILKLPTGVETWYLRLREPGGKQKHHRIGRLPAISRTLAREEAHKLLAAVAKGEAPTSARQELRRGPSVADLYERIKAKHHPKLRPSTVKGYVCTWDLHIIPALGSTKVQLVTTTQVVNLIEKIGGTQANRTLAIMRKAFNLAILWGMRADNPCAKVPGNGERKRRRYLTREELQRLLAALDGFAEAGVRWRFAQLVRLLLLTGCRVSEIKDARWEWLQGRVLVVPPECHKTGRDGHPRLVQLTPPALEVFQQLRARSNSDWIIQGDGDHPLVGYHKLWEELLAAAKITNLLVHDLRHSYASMAVSAGLSLPQIGGLLGHASPLTTARYAHLVDEAATAAAALVAAQIKTPAG